MKECLLGSGSCGVVFKMEHRPTKMTFAVKVFIFIIGMIVCFYYISFKVMSRTASDEENKRIIMDLDVLVKSYDFPHIVRCLGYFIKPVILIQKGITLYSVFYDYLVGSLDMYGIDGNMF